MTPRPTEATIYDGWLAVHRAFYGPPGNPHPGKSGWPLHTITHVPTSGYIAQFRHQRFAKKCAEELAAQVGRFEGNPGEEVLRLVVGICQRWLSREASELFEEVQVEPALPDPNALERLKHPCFTCQSVAWLDRGGWWACGVCHPAHAEELNAQQ